MSVMEDPEFKQFFDTYFTDEDSTHALLCFMRLYRMISKQYPAMKPVEKAAAVKQIIETDQYRHFLFSRKGNVKLLTAKL
jgi:hypothetical protein